MSKIYNNCLVILVLFLSSLSFADQVSDKPPEPAKLPSFLKPVTDVIALKGTSIFYNQLMEQRALENFDNRFIIVHFWASWCMDCNNELIALNNLQKDFRKKALLVISISEDFKGVDSIDKYFTKYKIDYLDIYLEKKNKIYQSLNINHLPASYLVDFDGSIIAESIPGVPVDWSDKDLLKFLDEKVSQHQLLPPEFKKTRDKYEEKKQAATPVAKSPPKTKSKIFIN